MIIYLNCDDNPTTWNKKNYLIEADRELGSNFVKDITECDGEPDFVLNIDPCTIKIGLKWTGLWHIDVTLDGPLPNEYSNVDTVFIASTQSKHLMGNGEVVLFQAADPRLHRRDPSVTQEYDYVLCGSISPSPFYDERNRTHNILKDHFSHKDYGKNFRPQDYVKNINTAKVQWVQPLLGHHGKGMLAQRFFECLAIGPVLVDWSEDLLYTGLIEGEDYLAYSSDVELINNMRRLLDDEKYRNMIAKNGRKKALLYHSYQQRLMSIINIAQDHVGWQRQ